MLTGVNNPGINSIYLNTCKSCPGKGQTLLSTVCNERRFFLQKRLCTRCNIAGIPSLRQPPQAADLTAYILDL